MSGPIVLWYTFRERLDRTNDPGTCLWCGLRLRAARSLRLAQRGAYGDYGDNAFCGLRCGYSFAVAAARHGFRLQPYHGDHQ